MGKSGLYLFFSIFALAGLACGAWGVHSIYTDYKIRNEGVKTVGEVVELSYSGKGSVAPVVSFRDELGYTVVYASQFYTNMVSYEIGQAIPLWYLPEDPARLIYLEGTSWITYFPLIFLFTHGGVGIGGLIWLERWRRKVKWLKNHGQSVKGRYIGAKNVSGKRPSFKAICEWKDPYTGTSHQFESDRIQRNPDTFLSADDTLWVLIDPANPKRYWVDMAFLEQK